MNYKECLIQTTCCSQTNFSSPSKETTSKLWTVDVPIPWQHVVAKERKMEPKKKASKQNRKKSWQRKTMVCILILPTRDLFFRICLQQNSRIINLKYIINN
uniref:Uncharacterized protein n=1 Tax=Micrurus lemniscatus lemniscatus TaxID=129467 RepID=A0A2D4J321_MICLE